MTLDGLRPLVVQPSITSYTCASAWSTLLALRRKSSAQTGIFSGSHQAVIAIHDGSIFRGSRLIPIQIGYPLVFHMDPASTQGHPVLLESLPHPMAHHVFYDFQQDWVHRNRSSSYKRSRMAFLISLPPQWRHSRHQYHDHRLGQLAILRL